MFSSRLEARASLGIIIALGLIVALILRQVFPGLGWGATIVASWFVAAFCTMLMYAYWKPWRRFWGKEQQTSHS